MLLGGIRRRRLKFACYRITYNTGHLREVFGEKVHRYTINQSLFEAAYKLVTSTE
jgi:hypothetical protein